MRSLICILLFRTSLAAKIERRKIFEKFEEIFKIEPESESEFDGTKISSEELLSELVKKVEKKLSPYEVCYFPLMNKIRYIFV